MATADRSPDGLSKSHDDPSPVDMPRKTNTRQFDLFVPNHMCIGVL